MAVDQSRTQPLALDVYNSRALDLSLPEVVVQVGRLQLEDLPVLDLQSVSLDLGSCLSSACIEQRVYRRKKEERSRSVRVEFGSVRENVPVEVRREVCPFDEPWGRR